MFEKFPGSGSFLCVLFANASLFVAFYLALALDSLIPEKAIWIFRGYLIFTSIWVAFHALLGVSSLTYVFLRNGLASPWWDIGLGLFSIPICGFTLFLIYRLFTVRYGQAVL